MTLDPQRWTLKTREAFQAATTQAQAAGNPFVTPAHLLLALLNQSDGVARPLLAAANIDPVATASALSERVAGEPRTVGGSQPGLSVEAREGLEAADELRGVLLVAVAVEDPEALFVHDLVGSEVVEVDGTQHGTVVAVQANPASDLLVMEDGNLVPLRFVVGCEDRRLVVDVPAGLFE